MKMRATEIMYFFCITGLVFFLLRFLAYRYKFFFLSCFRVQRLNKHAKVGVEGLDCFGVALERQFFLFLVVKCHTLVLLFLQAYFFSLCSPVWTLVLKLTKLHSKTLSIRFFLRKNKHFVLRVHHPSMRDYTIGPRWSIFDLE